MVFLNGVFKVMCSEGGRDQPQQEEPQCLKGIKFSGLFLKDLPLWQAEGARRCLENIVWKLNGVACHGT